MHNYLIHLYLLHFLLQYCVMEHFYSSPTSVLCILQSKIDDSIDLLNEDQLKDFQKLPSFQSYINKLPEQQQTKILSKSSTMKVINHSLL